MTEKADVGEQLKYLSVKCRFSILFKHIFVTVKLLVSYLRSYTHVRQSGA